MRSLLPDLCHVIFKPRFNSLEAFSNQEKNVKVQVSVLEIMSDFT